MTIALAVTKAICNKGFSGNSSILLRSNFGVSGQESSPQFLTAYSLSRYMQPKEKNIFDKELKLKSAESARKTLTNIR